MPDRPLQLRVRLRSTNIFNLGQCRLGSGNGPTSQIGCAASTAPWEGLATLVFGPFPQHQALFKFASYSPAGKIFFLKIWASDQSLTPPPLPPWLGPWGAQTTTTISFKRRSKRGMRTSMSPSPPGWLSPSRSFRRHPMTRMHRWDRNPGHDGRTE